MLKYVNPYLLQNTQFNGNIVLSAKNQNLVLSYTEKSNLVAERLYENNRG